MKSTTKEKTFKLDATLLSQTHNLLIGFMAVVSLIAMGAGVAEGIDNVKTTKEINKAFYGKGKLSKENKKDLAKDLSQDALIFIVAFAVVCVTINALRSSKRYNDEAAIRVARRYMLQMRKTNPELKKYDYILNNQMALHNIAAGIANILPMSKTLGMGTYWDIVRYHADDFETKTAELKHKNDVIQSVIDELKEVAEKDPQFMDKLKVLVDNSAKTFALDMYMTNQKTR